ncbi:MAG: tetratricopeptide repeat protein [Xanthobacteraceae bacterium]
MARAVAEQHEHARLQETEILAQALAGAFRQHLNGNVSEAEALYERILQIRPDHFDALHLLGVMRQQQNRSAEALRLIDAALRIVPGSADALSNRGVALRSLERLDEALASYDRALAINPEQIDALGNRASVLSALGRFAESLASADKALALNPHNRIALASRGNALFHLDRTEEARASFEHALLLASGDVDALLDLAFVLQKLGHFELALQRYTEALVLQPDRAEALSQRGQVLLTLGRPEEAIADYDRSLALRPDNVAALSNQGVALIALNRYEAALHSFDRALAKEPRADETQHYDEIRYNRSLALLTVGEFRGGWPDYEWRWKLPKWQPRQRNFWQPQWQQNVPVEGKTILLHAEQGMGDTLQFVRYASLLARRGANVVVEVQHPLKALLAQLKPVEVLSRGESLPAFDLHCPLMSMPMASGTELATIPADIPYIGAPPHRVGRWRDRLGARRLPRVGVVWAGSATHLNNHNRSISFDRFGVILSTPGIEFVSMQRELTPEDAAALNGHSGVLDFGEDLMDFADTAALISLLDVVVSVDTAVAHLAGAMGKPVWILLPFSPDFRWMIDRVDSPWYPTACLFRQTALGDWERPLGELRRALMSIADGG